MTTTAIHGDRFRLLEDRFAAHLIADPPARLGIDRDHPDGFAAALVDRFRAAADAGAIRGPDGFQVAAYATIEGGVLVAVRSTDSARRYQAASFAFAPQEVACFGDESFLECRRGIAALLRRADELRPALAAIQRGLTADIAA